MSKLPGSFDNNVKILFYSSLGKIITQLGISHFSACTDCQTPFNPVVEAEILVIQSSWLASVVRKGSEIATERLYTVVRKKISVWT